MIIGLLIALAIYLTRRESEAWGLLAQAKTHEAVANPNLPGHIEAMSWVNTTSSRAETAQARTKAAEAVIELLLRWVVGSAAALAVLRIAASAFAAGSAASGDLPLLAGWATVVDGIDTLLWLAVVV